MGLSLSQRDQEAQRIEAHKRVERLRAFGPDQMVACLIWLSGYDPLTFDAVLDAVESCASDEDTLASEPEPVCGICGEKIGIFLRLGLDWRHYRETRDALLLGGHGDAAPGIGQIELFEPGHAPVVTWRLFDQGVVARSLVNGVAPLVPIIRRAGRLAESVAGLGSTLAPSYEWYACDRALCEKSGHSSDVVEATDWWPPDYGVLGWAIGARERA